jgi:hypothetical protein
VSHWRWLRSTAGEQARVELGVDWRMNEPIRLAVGPVLHADDAVATPGSTWHSSPRPSERSTAYPTQASPNTASTRQARQPSGHGCTPGRRRSTATSAPSLIETGGNRRLGGTLERHPEIPGNTASQALPAGLAYMAPILKSRGPSLLVVTERPGGGGSGPGRRPVRRAPSCPRAERPGRGPKPSAGFP